MKQAKKVSTRELLKALKRAVATYRDTCNCDECGPCRDRLNFERLIRNSEAKKR